MSATDISDFKRYKSLHQEGPNDIKPFISSLEISLTKSKKQGKGSRSILHTFDKPDLPISSWKFQEWDYSRKQIELPSQARGLFTVSPDSEHPKLDHKIIARGYDKFFNINEVEETKRESIKNNTKGPYEVTLKTNGCIILVSGLDDGTLVVCSKHSTGENPNNYRNHSQQGKKWIEQQLREKSLKPRDLALTLAQLDVTAVAEYCNDEFEEHVLPYSGDSAGLYLHGLNFNSQKFNTYPMEYVNRFAEMFNFKKTDYFVENSVDKMMQFFDKASETGMYKGEEIEGFVVRCRKSSDNSVFFWKYKFEEPYLMYREWREATKRLIKLGEFNSSFDQYNPITKDYLKFVETIIKEKPQIGKYYKSGYGIIDLRKLYLHKIGKEGYELVKSNSSNDKEIDYEQILSSSAVAQSEIDAEVDEILQKFEKISLAPEPVTETVESEEQVPIFVITKYVIIPIAIVGCGKSTVARILKSINPSWGMISNDDLLKFRGLTNRLERKALQFLMGDTSCLEPANINEEVVLMRANKLSKNSPYANVKKNNIAKNKDTILNTNNVIIIDKNNHMKRERKDLFKQFEDLKAQYLTNDGQIITLPNGESKKLSYKFRFIALDFVGPQISPELWEKTVQRVADRGENHQMIKVTNEEELAKATVIMEGFKTRFQPMNVAIIPDSRFDLFIRLDTVKQDSKENALKVLKAIHNQYPEICLVPSEQQLDKAFEKALTFKPVITKPQPGGKQRQKIKPKKASNIVYFAIGIAKDQFLNNLEKVLASNSTTLANSSLGEFYNLLKSKDRVQSSFHVTLSHKNDNNKANFNQFADFFAKESGDSNTHSQIKFDVILKNIIWDNMAMTVQVEIVKTNLPLSPTNEYLHITVGTADKTIKPVYSKKLIEVVSKKQDMNLAKMIIKDDFVVVPFEKEVVLKDQPLTVFR